MFKSTSSRIIALALIGALTLAGCGKKEEEPVSAGVLAAEDSVLQYVPADSPYVMANVEPLPDELVDKIEPKLDKVLKAYDALIREGYKMAVAKAEAEGHEGAGDSEKMAKAAAVIDELSSLLSVEGLRGAGFSRESTAVIYGNGLLPVMRVTVSDGALFDAAIARLEQQAGDKLPVATIGDAAFRYVDAEEVKLIIGAFANQVVLALAPQSFDDAQLGELLGLTPPESSIADTGLLAEIATEYGFTGHYVGYVDVERIVETLVGTPTGLDAALIDLMGADKPQLSAVCQAEIRSVAGIVPRIVMGYSRVTAGELESQAVIELRDDIATGLAGLTAEVPGLGGDKGGLMSFGLSFDAKAARSFYEARLDALEAEPFECEHFAELQAGVAAGRQALSAPVPPMVYDFKGFLAVINDLEGLDLASNTPPSSIEGRVLLAMDNAPNLLALGAMFSPDLAGLSIEPDGQPVSFEPAQMQGIVDAAHIALSDAAIAMSFGAGAERELAGMLAADPAESGTFLSFSMDAGRYYAFIGEAMMLAEQDEENPMPPEFQAAMNEIMIAFSDFYDRVVADVRLTARGIEIDSTITLQD